MQTYTQMFDTYEDAAEAVRSLEAAGVPHSQISLLGARPGDAATTADAMPLGAAPAGTYAAADGVAPVPGGTTMGAPADPHAAAHGAEAGAGAGASIGTLLGGGAGLLAGIGSLAIPGVGPIVAAGWLIATMTGAGVGAAAGGLLGSLTGAGVPEADAHVYAEGVRRGGTLVTVRTDDESGPTILSLLTGARGAVDVGGRRDEYTRSGWAGYDESASLTPDQTTEVRGSSTTVL